MPNVMILCPEKKTPVPTGIGASKQAFETSTMTNNTFRPCPACGKAHTWNKEDAFLEGEAPPAKPGEK